MSTTHTYVTHLVGHARHPETSRNRTLRLPVVITDRADGRQNASLDWTGTVHGQRIELHLTSYMGKAGLVMQLRDILRCYGMSYQDVV